jgi:hypothetical protein
MTSDTGLLLLAEHAASSGDIARIGTALAPKPGWIICEDELANDAGVATNGLLQKGRTSLFKYCLGVAGAILPNAAVPITPFMLLDSRLNDRLAQASIAF